MPHSPTIRLRPGLGLALLCCVLVLAACKRDAAAPDAATSAPSGNETAAQAKTDDAQAAANGARDAAPAPTVAAALIGRSVPPFPDGLQEVQGVCVSGGEGLEHVCDYGLAILGRGIGEDTPATQELLIASRNLDTAADRPTWQVLDARDAPRPAAGYELQIGSCRLDGVENAGLIAVVRHSDENEYSKDVTWAARFDTAAGKLVDVENARVDCVNVGLGV